MTTTNRISLHGFTVAPHLRIAALPSADEVEIVTKVGDPTVDLPDLDPIIAESRSADDPELVLMRVSGGNPTYVIEWPGLLAAKIDAQQSPSALQFAIPPIVPATFESLLISPAVGVLATLEGNLVLHGSSVEINGKAVTLLAEAGGGKSSVTALLCHGGARLIAEDVSTLRCSDQDSVDQGVSVYSGIHEIRLRTTNAWISSLAGLPHSRHDVDGRIVLSPQPTERSRTAVQAIALVQLDRHATAVSTATVSPTHAVALLLMCQRTSIVSSHPLAIAMLDRAVRVVSKVQVKVLTVPWDESRRTGALGHELMEQLAGL
jgi:hypothetical protein